MFYSSLVPVPLCPTCCTKIAEEKNNGEGTYGQRGGGGSTLLGVKNKSPPLHQRNGYPSQKSLTYSTLYPLFMAFFTAHVSSSIKLRSCSS